MRKILTVIVLLSSLLLTGCFDVVEELNMNPNGAGTIKLTVNLSKSKTKVASLMKLDKVDGLKVPSKADIRKETEAVVRLLKQTGGISNVQHTLDFDNFIATISCGFNDIKALNAFTKTLSTHFKVQLSPYSSYAYQPAKKELTRSYTYHADMKKEFSKLKASSQEAFNQAYYTSIYRFQDEVKQQTNTGAKISANKKAVMAKVSVLDIIQGKANLSNRITLSH